MQDLSKFQHPRFARAYQRLSAESERQGMAAHRRDLLAGLRGRVIEVGAGNGLNFAHYPDTVEEVVAVEPEHLLRAMAEEAAASARVPVRVVPGHAGALPVADGTFDAAVLSLVLCSVPDQVAALLEVRRALAAGGEMRFLEHVRSGNPLKAIVQDLLTPLWWRMGGGCRLNRDTAAAIMASGLVIEEERRFPYRPMPVSLTTAHIMGRARNPAA
ncbi:methyltransferase domain-containing protein [Nonomuraea sp. NN258]|uniref:class I SAM-dependent methyltransferase n=1 Tax=Nonomuraea antri TaxID=2730852 RepID=UPI00156981FA|nr:methyltransferase domain-containing protein [Nonomuraea antri]NRQ38249.1 methyltransferase domain-containing protein [Nonomuraea antri]